MKKVGIMTMHRIINYGSFLQAYALSNIIKNFGYKVELIDFHYGEGVLETKEHGFFYKSWVNKDVYHYIRRKKLYNNVYQEIYKGLADLGTTEEKNYSHNIDTLIIGSDEVFNCIQGPPVGYSLDFFGKGYEDKNVISYAASFGHTTMEKLNKYGKTQEIGEYLKKFNNISVRDENSKNIVKKLTGKKPFLHYDPVIVGDFSKILDGKDAPMKDYIIVYAYQKRLTKEEEKYIKKFAKRNKKKIVSLGFYQKIADYNLAVPVYDVLNWFKHADFVITDTFHGTIFSIVTNNNFCTMIRDTNRNKLTSLLDGLDKKDQIVNKLTDIDKIYKKKISYGKTNSIIKKEREKTIKYLKENV